MFVQNRIWLLVSAIAALPMSAHAQSPSTMVVDIPQDGFYHKPACPLVREAGSKVSVMRLGQAERKRMKPHDCPVLADGTEDPNAVSVYIQEGDGRYHKEGCEKLGEDAKKVALAEGGKGRWPCTTCRPPIRKPPAGASQLQTAKPEQKAPGGGK